MGWNNIEETTKQEMTLSSKILIAIIACIILIIILSIIILLMSNASKEKFTVSVDGIGVNTKMSTLLTNINGTTYINIEEFAKLVGYEYHLNEEYKDFKKDENKCYVKGKEETASFFINDNKVCKLPVNELMQEYREYNVEGTIKVQNGSIYAPLDAIKIAFNVVLDNKEEYLKIYTLDGLAKIYDDKVKKWGYTGILQQNFENKKALLYGCLIVQKQEGLYKIIDSNNTKEIVSDKYNLIEFTENTQEFFVTNSLKQVGIINIDGTTKIEPIYNSISVLDKKTGLYIVEKEKKYGVVKSGNINIIFPEYDNIGLTDSNLSENKYLILDTLIPVLKNNKWGAFDKNGKLIYKAEYDGFGCNLTTLEIEGTKKTVNPVLEIKRCNGVVVKKLEKYGILDLEGNEIVPIAVDNIYEVQEPKNEDFRYFMLYNGEEVNLVERLIKAGIIEGAFEEETKENETVKENSILQNTNVSISNNIINQITHNANLNITQ